MTDLLSLSKANVTRATAPILSDVSLGARAANSSASSARTAPESLRSCVRLWGSNLSQAEVASLRMRPSARCRRASGQGASPICRNCAKSHGI